MLMPILDVAVIWLLTVMFYLLMWAVVAGIGWIAFSVILWILDKIFSEKEKEDQRRQK